MKPAKTTVVTTTTKIQKPRNRQPKKAKAAAPAPKNTNKAQNQRAMQYGQLSDGLLNNLTAKYVKHLADPEFTEMVGIPDGRMASVKTGLIHSVQTFPIYANTTDGVNALNAGRFAAVISPTFGDGGSASNFKVSVPDNTLSWPSDFSDNNNAAFVRNAGGVTLTTDPNYTTMLAPSLFYYEANGSSPLGGGGPLGDAGALTINPTTMDSVNPALGGPNLLNPQAGTGFIELPSGQYELNLETTFVGPVAIMPSHVVVAGVIPAGSSVSISNQYNSVVNGESQANSVWILSIYGSSAQFAVSWSAPPAVAFNTDISINASWARPDRLNNPAPGYAIDGGVIKKYVPVAMSVLCSYTASPFTVAGKISGSLLPPETCAKNVFTQVANPAEGNPLYYESNCLVPGAYDGPLVRGTYVNWRPFSMDDMILRSPSEQRTHEWPCICVAGIASFSPGAAGLIEVARLRIVTTYQFATMRTCFELELRDGSTLALEAALRLLRSFPTASANGVHLENIKNFFQRIFAAGKKAYSFYKEHQDVIDPAVRLAGNVLPALF